MKNILHVCYRVLLPVQLNLKLFNDLKLERYYYENLLYVQELNSLARCHFLMKQPFPQN